MRHPILRLLPIAFLFALAGCTESVAECPETNATCSARCVNLQIDRNNCGSCGNVCSAGFQCVEGACTDCPEGGCPEGDVYAACFGAGTVVGLERETLAEVGAPAQGMDGPQSLALFGSEWLLSLGSMDQTLYVIDRATMQPVGSILTGASPNQVLVRGSRAYVIVSMENTVQVIDLTDPVNPTTVDEVSLGENTNPMAAAFDERGVLWVSTWLTDELYPVDFSGSRGVVGDAIALDTTGLEGSAYPAGVAVVGDVVYVALNNLDENYQPAGNGRLATWNRETKETGLVDLGATCTNAGMVAVAGDLVYVACTGNYVNGEVVVYDASADEVTRRVALEGGPSRLALDPVQPGAFFVADGAGPFLLAVGADDEVQRLEMCPAGDWEFVSDVAVAP